MVEFAGVLFYAAKGMPFTAADAEALRRAIADGKGARSMSFSDQTVVFSSPKEMLELLAAIDAEVAGSLSTRRSYRIGVTSKGV